MTVFTCHPLKAIWALVAAVINVVRLPIWVLYYIPSSTRPHPAWSLQQAVYVQVAKKFLWNAAMIEMKTDLSLLPKAEKERWTVVQLADKKYYTGIIKSDPTIKPTPCGGTWYPAKPSQTNMPGLVVLHYHGGAYVMGDGRTKDVGFAVKTLITNTQATHVFAPQYRLSSNNGCQFPAALQDAVTTYSYLVLKEGIPENRIIVSGDSAGGNLALALTKYLTDHKGTVPLAGPLCTLLWSPWVSPSRSLSAKSFKDSPNNTTDYVTAEFAMWGAKALMPNKSSGLTLDNPYISFRDNAFMTSTPIYISTGECEVLFHDNVELYEQMKAIPGNQVELQVEEHAVHDIFLTGAMIGFEKEATQAVQRVSKFIGRVTYGAKL